MKNVRRIVFGILFSILIAILVYFFSKGVVITKPEYENINKVFYIILFVIFLYYLFFYVIRPTVFKYFKVVNTFVGIGIVFISQYYIANSGVDGIYYGDILCLVGVVLTIIGPTNALISKKDQKEKDLEIIEA